MEIIFDTKEQLYKRIVELFETHLKNNNLTTNEINPKFHGISRRQFFYIKNISDGKEAPDISDKKIEILLSVLKVKLEITTYYKLSEI